MGQHEPVGAYKAESPAFTFEVGGSRVNALMYIAASGPKNPTLILLHGFPGYEQNLDLAQAARREGWNVFTFHYRGTWGSEGPFSFSGALEDTEAAITYLISHAAKYRVEPERIVIAGHSMGAMMGARAAASDTSIKGLFLIDAWDISEDALAMDDVDVANIWRQKFVAGVPGITNTDGVALFEELKTAGRSLALAAALEDYGLRPLDIIGASRGKGARNTAILRSLQKHANPSATGEEWSTDHSFNDCRIALTQRLITWLAQRV